jgi:hypothetical protein
VSEDADRFAAARLVADAVLYEGYVLYPYRASATKNQVRWQFGVLAPPDYATQSGTERASMRTEVVVATGDHPVLSARIRCLHVQRREVEAVVDGGFGFAPVAALDVDGTRVPCWDEAIEREIDLDPLRFDALDGYSSDHHFTLAAGCDEELLVDANGVTVGRVTRRRERVDGVVRVIVEPIVAGTNARKLTVIVENTTAWNAAGADRDHAMRHALLAVHTLLGLEDGAFVSSLEPPQEMEAAVAGCENDGTYPVLIGAEGSHDVVLSSPIILYDHPAIAPESAGDFCDATEIDEILALRVLTLTDDEKAEARGTDARAAAIIDRCDDMPAEIWSRLHGAVRSLRPVDDGSTATSTAWWDPGLDGAFDPFTDTMTIGRATVGNGTRVRLRPSRRADAHDLFYTGRLATVKGVFNDVDGERHIAVALDDDPAGDMLEWQGRFLYFHPEEIEVLA